MPCPKCGRIYCDHSAEERGETREQMLKNMQFDLEEGKKRMDKEQEAVVKNNKERALMIVIEKIIARYQNQHVVGDLDEEIFKLFEKAKKIKSAETENEFQLAIADL
ncbi:MAG: hypothetical protein QMD50_03605 [Patescibacteria group bacterium]|nr:hypothetical protein [Patescibacteria group bacterium]